MPAVTDMVWANARSLATTSAITIVFFSSGYLDVSVLRVRLLCRITCLQHAGLPHSDTCGSKSMCLSPQLFAACRVLHRLWEPRHSPYALIQLMCFYLICSSNHISWSQNKSFLQSTRSGIIICSIYILRYRNLNVLVFLFFNMSMNGFLVVSS